MVRRAALCVWSALSIGCGSEEPKRSTTQDTSSTSQRPASYRAMVYSASFAKRFALPQGGVQKLDEGLHALVLRIVERADDHPGCYLDFYLDDTLDLAFPEGSEGVASRADDENPYFFVRDPAEVGAANQRWNARTGSFHALKCREEPNNCLVEESGPSAYARHLLPGLALQTYAVMCNALDPKYAPTEMWLLRAGRDAKELLPQAADEAATYRFAMPAALFEHAAGRIRQAIKFYEDMPLGPEPPRNQFTVPEGK